jgi:predicted site-specific integrase-resolvase
MKVAALYARVSSAEQQEDMAQRQTYGSGGNRRKGH